MSSTHPETSNSATIEWFHEAINSGDLERVATSIDELLAPDAVFHSPVPSDVSVRQAMKGMWETLLRAFPDLHVAIEDVITEGDKVVFRNVVTGTHRGEYRGLAPTGKTITYDEIFIVRFVDGRIAEGWGVVDVLAQLRQLGAVQI